MVGSRVVDRVIGLISTAVLARLLTPGDFGIVAMATAVVVATELLGAFGFDWALVRQENLTKEHMNTAWTLRCALAILSASVLLLVSNTAATYYSDARVGPVLAVLAMSLTISALENPGAILFRREFRFDREFVLRTGARLLSTVAALAAAYVMRSYWALLIGILVGRTTSTSLSYLMHPFRPRPSLAAIKDLFSFSTWLFANNVLAFAYTRFADFAIGRAVGARAVGLYSVAYELAHLGHTEIAAPINRAAFSEYSARSGDKQAMRGAYLTAVGGIWLIASPLAVGAILTAPQLVALILGQGWIDAIPVLQTLGIGALLSLSYENASYVYWAIGKPQLSLAMNGTGAAIFLPLMTVLLPTEGVIGVAHAYIVSSGSVAILNMLMMRHQLSLRLRDVFLVSWRTIFASCAMAMVVLTVAPTAIPPSAAVAVTQLLVLVCVGALAYVACLSILWILSGKPTGAEAFVVSKARGAVEHLRAGGPRKSRTP